MLIFAGKRALFDRLTVLQGSDSRLTDIQIAYTEPGDKEDRCVFGLSGRFERSPSVAEYVALQEDDAVIDLVIESFLEGDDGREGESIVEAIALAISEDLAVNPKTAGGLTWTGVTGGDIVYRFTANPEPSVTTSLILHIGCQGHAS